MAHHIGRKGNGLPERCLALLKTSRWHTAEQQRGKLPFHPAHISQSAEDRSPDGERRVVARVETKCPVSLHEYLLADLRLPWCSFAQSDIAKRGGKPGMSFCHCGVGTDTPAGIVFGNIAHRLSLDVILDLCLADLDSRQAPEDLRVFRPGAQEHLVRGDRRRIINGVKGGVGRAQRRGLVAETDAQTSQNRQHEKDPGALSHIGFPAPTTFSAFSVADRSASGPTGTPVAFFIQRSGATLPIFAIRSNSEPILPAFFICSSI